MRCIKILQYAGDITAISAKKFPGIRLLHGLNFLRIEIVNFHSGERIKYWPKLG